MGIDKPDIRRIVHLGSPHTLEEYLQQIGRAGRDGLPADCVLLYSDSDLLGSAGYRAASMAEHLKANAAKNLMSMRNFANCDSNCCRRVLIMEYFKEEKPFDKCGNCDLCLNSVAHEGDMKRDFTVEGQCLFTGIYMYICVYMCIYMHIYIHVYVCTYIYICV
jgi:superfamily II DNA helicase RecQ